jgi:hypothetical protein
MVQLLDGCLTRKKVEFVANEQGSMQFGGFLLLRLCWWPFEINELTTLGRERKPITTMFVEKQVTIAPRKRERSIQ